MSLLDKLKANDKKGLFKEDSSSDMYETGFLPFDYRNGTIITAKDKEDKVLERWQGLGMVGGTLTTIIGKSGTAKTTFVIQAAVNTIRKYEDAMVLHYDIEQATTYTRIRNITGISNKELEGKYFLSRDNVFIQDIFTGIMKVVELKESLGDSIKINTGKLDELGRPLIVYPPTIVIIDSIPGLASKENKDDDSMQGSTYANRIAKELSQFHNRLVPILRPYNISIIEINHLKTKIDINPMAKTQAQIMYLKQDEAVPGGTAPIYYSNLYLKFVSSKKLNVEDDGINGMIVKVQLIKSRTNTAGHEIELVYNQITGFSPALSLLHYAKEKELLGGRNPKLYFISDPEVKFSRNEFEAKYTLDPAFREMAIRACKDSMETMLSVNADLLTAESGSETDESKEVIDMITAEE
jgi:hypothetical protein